ncbi:conserved hypothetical protein [Gloeothece citriformis PCC 7424]|uniref:Nonspecific acid phosphatase n=1 Tax=Gloeothece citriformis (strain PCC 7424) TaxID=65393 RepID=B7K785_GLOC7|nr:HAD family hydrolase [Gloeothece citriformis]ACK69653.1 conserved hypothetical protein [Gloeothece citriformis PCC 7424]
MNTDKIRIIKIVQGMMVLMFALATFTVFSTSVLAQSRDPLPSWNEGMAKSRIMEFVEGVAQEDSPNFVPISERIAVFDNDGTLWPEQPLVQVLSMLAKLEALATVDPSLRERQPFKAALEQDSSYFTKEGIKAVIDVVVTTMANMTQEEFEADAQTFIETAIYPRLNQPISNLAYKPMVELLNYLRANGFQTWICSGGGIDFIRLVSEQLYGVPPQQVIGSTLKKEYREENGKNFIWRRAEIDRINDKEGKPVGIDLYIGKRPIFAMGNVRSGGDIAMLSYSQAQAKPSLQLIINHDDSKREFAYQEPDNASLNAALKNGWTVVSIKNDWKTVFYFKYLK